MLRKTEDELKAKNQEILEMKDSFCAQQTQIEQLLQDKDQLKSENEGQIKVIEQLKTEILNIQEIMSTLQTKE